MYTCRAGTRDLVGLERAHIAALGCVAVFGLLVGRFEDLEGAKEVLVHRHHGARVVKLACERIRAGKG